eukprot:gene1615-1765_t
MPSSKDFRHYVESSGVEFTTLTNEEKRGWRETFDKSCALLAPRTDLTDQISEISKAVTYLVEERKNERKTVKKDGSKASVGEYNRFFCFSIFPAEGWLANNVDASTAFRTSTCPLIFAHQSAMKEKRDRGLVREVEDVQPESKALLQQLMDLYFTESVVYNSWKTDAVIKSSEWDVAVVHWEVKNQRIALRDGGEIAQTAAEVSG